MTNPGLFERYKVFVAIAVTVLFWASAFVSIRSAGHEFSPGALALGRLVAGSLVLGAFCFFRGEGMPSRAAWPGILVAGVVWFCGYMVLLNWGEQKVDAGTAAMVVNVGPLLVALLGGWLLKEGFPARLFAGMAVSFAGAAIVGIATSNGSNSSVFGVVLCLMAAFAFAIGVVSQKFSLAHASALQVTTFSCIVGTVACLPFAGQLFSEIPDASAGAIGNTIYLGVFPTALAFTTWAYALTHTTAGKLGATTYVVPTLVIVISWLFLGEVPTLLALAGGLLCLVGVAVARTRPKMSGEIRHE